MAKPSPMLDGPVAGQALTSEPGARPWEQPAMYSTVEGTLLFYLENLSQPKKLANMLDKIEEGAPLTLIADTLQTAGVTKGIHSLDVGILISPVLIEFMKAAADHEGIAYTLGIEENEDEIDENLANAVVKKVFNGKKDNEVMPEPTSEEKPEQQEKGGLMSRPVKKSEEVVNV